MFGKFLVEKGFIGQELVDEALKIQKKHKRQKLGRLLIDLEYLDQKNLDMALTSYLNPQITKDISELRLAIEKVNCADEINKLTRKYRSIVLFEDNTKIELLRTNVVNDELISALEAITGKEVHCWVCSKDTFDFLRQSQSGQTGHQSKIVVSRNLSDDDRLCGSSPYAKLFKEIVTVAKRRSVSDIHIEPLEEGIIIRFRLYGSLQEYKTLSKDHREGLISTIKRLVNMDLAIVGRPQDSRASFKALKLDLRANSLPKIHGEKIVLRLLNQDSDFDLEKSGLSKDSLRVLRGVSKRKDGLILISGPTGSGKTTTLYSLLHELPRDKLNVSTLENPVEYALSGINQINIKEGGPLTFESSLRALMRQDPDVILVGEIRDKQTADLAFKAASTGHLVLSTVHANGAKEVVERLLNLGVDAFTIKSNLRLSAAQRLFPLLCPHCSIPTSALQRKQNPDGCPQCEGGVMGRTAVLEYMIDSEIRQYLEDQNNQSDYPINSLKKAAHELVEIGKIDCAEILSL